MPIAAALVVSSDPVTIRQFGQALEELSISLEVCREVPASIHLLNRRKFDAVIIDLQLGEASASLLDEVRVSRSNRTAVTFAISGSEAEANEAFRKGSILILERPLSMQCIRSTLKPAYGLILRERRRYFRCPLSVPVVILRRDHSAVRCHSINISEGGMAISTFVPLPSGEDVQVEFTLPDQTVRFVVDAKICWWQTGHLGIRFESFRSGHKVELQGWLSQMLEKTLPGYVAGKFRKEKIDPPDS